MPFDRPKTKSLSFRKYDYFHRHETDKKLRSSHVPSHLTGAVFPTVYSRFSVKPAASSRSRPSSVDIHLINFFDEFHVVVDRTDVNCPANETRQAYNQLRTVKIASVVAMKKDKGESLTVSVTSPKIVACNENNNQSGVDVTEKKYDVKVYKMRWVVLALFIFYSAVSTLQWVEYSIISNIVSRYYGVSSLAVDWTSMVYMLYYLILVVPGSYVAEKVGLRWTTIMGCSLCCLGSWIKVFSVHPDRFWLTFVGQSFVASMQVLILITPGRLSAQWFNSNQLSTATSLAIFGNQLGIAIGFLVTPIVVRNHVDLDDIGDDLSRLFWAVAIVSSVATVLVIIFFRDEPRLPPSHTRALQRDNWSENKENYVEPMKRLFKNKSFLILCNTYGLNVGVFNAIGTLLNQIYLSHFENGEKEAGELGLVIILMGMVGSVAFGVILDKTQKYKGTTVAVYLLTLLGQIMFAIAMWCEAKRMIYFAAMFLGIFMSGYLALGYEMCAEYTYPEAESIATGILNVTNNIYGIILVLISGALMETYGDFGVHVCLCLALLVGFVMTVMTKDETRRLDARNAAKYSTVKTKDEITVSDSGGDPQI